MKPFFATITQAGLEGLEDPFDYRRVLFINNLSLVSSGISFAVAILLFVEQLVPQLYVVFGAGTLFSLVVYFNYQRRYGLARAYFLLLSVVTISSAAIAAYGQGRFNEAENILIGFMAVSYLLYDSVLRKVGFWIIFTVLIGLKFIKQQYVGEPYELNFYISIQNTTILCLLMYLFIEAFKKTLLSAFVRLKEKDEVLYSMIDSVPLYIGLIDTDRRYRMVNINYERSFGMKRAQIIGSKVEDVLPINILDKHLPLIKNAINGESPEFLEYTKMPDGSAFYAAGKYIPVRNSRGAVVGVSVFVNDVTKLEVAKNELEEANSTKNKLFSIMAHDIRGPLDLFDGLLEMSADGALSREDFHKHQMQLREKLSDLRDTVNTLLDWARTQLDGVSIRPAATNINEIVQTNLDLYHELIEQKNIAVSMDLASNAKAWIDENHLKIGVRNMVHNALKFTSVDGFLHIRTRMEGDHVILSIKDSGMGMDEATIEAILNKQMQNSKRGTSGEGGTGLGMSLSMELLERNNCEVKILSTPGKGTEIIIKMIGS